MSTKKKKNHLPFVLPLGVGGAAVTAVALSQGNTNGAILVAIVIVIALAAYYLTFARKS